MLLMLFLKGKLLLYTQYLQLLLLLFEPTRVGFTRVWSV